MYLVNQSKKINAYLAILTYIIERFLKMKKFLMSVHVCMDILINFIKLEIWLVNNVIILALIAMIMESLAVKCASKILLLIGWQSYNQTIVANVN